MKRLTLLVVLFVSAPAAADDTSLGGGRVERGAPTRISIGPSEFGQLPEAIAQTRLGIGAGATLLVDTQNLFGTIGMNVNLRGSYAISDRLWVGAALNPFELRNVINASISPSKTNLGPLTTSVHYTAYKTRRSAVSPYFRVMWPTSTAYTFARGWGFELGMSNVNELHRWVSLFTGVILPLELTGLGARVLVKFNPILDLELGFHPAKWVDILLALELRLGIDKAGVIEHLAPKFAVRFYPVGGLFIELKGMLPVAGLERTDYVFGGGVGWVFGEGGKRKQAVSMPSSLAASVPAPAPSN